MNVRRFASRLAVLFVIVGFVPSAPVLAGTTGGLSGRVLDAVSGAPVAAASVTATSPSQTASVATDAGGRFAFVSLAPDTYTVSIEKPGFDPVAQSGVSVFADAQQTASFSLRKALRTIGRVTTRSNGDLVKPGTTADIYSVNAAQQDRVAALGGGGNLNSAYSAIASVPGAYVPANQTGYNETVHVRGGDSDQVGYELDGIPVNRGFDNYPSGSASSLGQQELQVYTGASPANSEAQGLAGFVNQVIKTGTFPGSGVASFALGGPAFYHNVNAEYGGANRQRTFSYYVAAGGFNQDQRYVDPFNGQSYANQFGPILFDCPAIGAPSSCFQNGAVALRQSGMPGYALGPLQYGGGNVGAIANNATRSAIVNIHIGLPHKNGGLKDDIQLLYDNDEIYSSLYSSALDEGLGNVQAYNGTNSLYYTDSWQYRGATGTFLPPSYTSLVVPYLFPSSPQARAFGAAIPLDQRDVQYNQQGIFKLQYQKNFSSAAFLRLYGYTYYSDYIGTGPNSSYQPYTGLDSGDYELSAHTRGLSATFADQLDSRNLLELQSSYTTSHALRMYNTQMFGNADAFAALVNKNDLTSGTCYALQASGVPQPTTCSTQGFSADGVTPLATFASLMGIGCATHVAGCQGALPAAVDGLTCGTGPCGYYVAENGRYGEYNLVKPIFTGYSITDQFKPTDKLLFNLGLRLDNYTYQGSDTTGTPARAFWFDAYNHDTCFNTQTGQLTDKTQLPVPLPIASPCSAESGIYRAVNLQNTPSQRTVYEVLQPRLGMTYTLTPDTVVRASYGKYNEQPSSAYQQYDALQQNLPQFLGPEFYSFGFTTPGHSVRPQVSYNADFSLEHRFHGTDVSFKLTPFYRQTHDQLQNFYLNVQAGLVSGLNIGKQTSDGFEFAFNKGDFGSNGLAAQLSFAYTNSYVQYGALPNGRTIVSPINADIQQYNAYTSYCASHPADLKCGGVDAQGAANVLPSNQLAAAACYAGGSPADCAGAGAVANPYWNAPPQPLLDPNGKYAPYSIFPAGVGTGANSFNYPYVATLILNYKRGRFALTPSLQFQAGNRYGAPETTPGIDPAAAACAGRAGVVAGDPRYPYGAAGGSPYDAAGCAGALLNAIPDPYTGHFDALGEFREPAQLLGNVRFSYEATKNLEFVATFANVVNRCFGGQKTGFTYYTSGQVCSYGSLQNFVAPVGNAYNPGDNIQTFLKYPYEPAFGTYNDAGSSLLQPFAMYFSLRAKL